MRTTQKHRLCAFIVYADLYRLSAMSHCCAVQFLLALSLFQAYGVTEAKFS